jgi:hypothetical protein
LKNLLRVFIITAGVVLLFNVNSFALVDGAAWGGYAFKGEVEGNSDAKPKGGQYGVKAHYNTSLIPFIELGLGGYYQNTKINFDITSFDTIERKSAGLDVNIILSLPIIHPYIRGTYAFWDKLDTDVEKYKAYGYGAGLELTVFPFIRIFGEYMYDHTEHNDAFLKMNSVNFGLKADI